jgi:uncharacterized protein YjdB
MHVLRSSRVGLRSAIVASRHVRDVKHIARAILPVAALAVAGLVACKEAADPVKVAAIVGMNPADSVRLGKTITFVIETRDAAGNKLTGRKVNWSSLNPGIATVDADGIVTGVALGSSIISARIDGVTAQTNVSVQPVVASVVLSPSSASVAVGANRSLTVTVSDKNGLALSGRLIAFSSSAPNVATVNGSGVVVGVSQGRAIITGQAVQDQVSGTSTIDVVQVPVTNVAITPAGAQTVFQGLTLQLAATLRDGSGNILTGRTVSWTTSNSSIATVSSAGLVTGVALGVVQITCESEGITSSVTVTVQLRPVATVILGPNPGGVKVGQQLQMALDLRDASGNALTTAGRTVTWDSSNNPVATVSNGVVSGVSPGSTTITVTVDSKPASAVVTVTP